MCLGLQCAVIEFSRNVLGLDDAHSTEFNAKTKNPVVNIYIYIYLYFYKHPKSLKHHKSKLESVIKIH